ncbi:MAG TPA: 8-amino-7-oxononanoate synthase [Alcanivoracaceae bacterium]|nr:8-amino-7-oxononanoate synthase [Alcanivoracaceae bacterium]
MSAYAYFHETVEHLKAADNHRQFREIEQRGRWVQGEQGKLLNVSSNDYLGIATNEELVQAFYAQLDGENQRLSSSSSRLLTGHFAAHEQLEESLNRAYGRSSLLFNTGYHMNVGILPALCDANTLVLSDELIHASMIDGIRLSKAQRATFAHQDFEQLEQQLAQAQEDPAVQRVLVVVESLYSMDGDSTDLPALVALKQRYPNTMLYVDEAHAVGVFGATGLGLAEHYGCIEHIDFLLGTFGKALASQGGFVITAPVVREFLINRARSLIFSTALPPINAAWGCFAFEAMRGMVKEREHLAAISQHLREALVAQGRQCPGDSHIVPIVYGDNASTLAHAARIREQGVYALPIRPPTVPKNQGRVRICLRADLSWDDIARLEAVL